MFLIAMSLNILIILYGNCRFQFMKNSLETVKKKFKCHGRNKNYIKKIYNKVVSRFLPQKNFNKNIICKETIK